MPAPLSPEPVLTCTVSEDLAEIVSAVLFGSGALAIGEEHTVDGVELRAGFSSELDAHDAAAEIRPWTTATVTMIVPTWQDDQRAGFEPVAAGRWFISLPDAAIDAPVELIHLRIDPGRSFGHGAHPTTHLMLELMAATDLNGRHVLDVGTGTGVLAVAAASVGADVVAVDNDAEAVGCAVENAKRNEVDGQIDVRLSDGGASSPAGTVDVALVNVTIDQHRRIAPTLTHAATVVISGVLEHQLDEAVVLYDAAPIAVRSRAGWSAAVLRRADGAASEQAGIVGDEEPDADSHHHDE